MSNTISSFATVDPFDGMTGDAPAQCQNLVGGQWVSDSETLTVPDPLNGETVLLGRGGCLDSLALVTLVVALEEAVEERCDKTVALADEEAFSQKRSPYRTIGRLAPPERLTECEAGLV